MDPRTNEQTLRQKTVEGIKKYMEYHKLNPGDRLPPERQMAKRFGISRTIVRDAVNTLAGLGILEVKHRSGIYMSSVDSKTLASQLSMRLIFNRNSAINLFQVRQVLETAVARWAAEQCDQDGEDKLRKLMKETRRCLSEDNTTCFREIDSRFHILLAEISKNPIVVDLIKTLLEYMQSLRHFSLSLPAKVEECARQHEIIFEAVCDRSPGRAAAAMEEHLQTVLSAVTDNWEDFAGASERIAH
ncbi:MAG: FadR/GntR family transcriptional regulator [Desulfobacterales bacterium]|jgi:GntR family transcriptional repressor for pyruvate dehydrogenase complex